MQLDKTLRSLDTLGPWIMKIDFRESQWHAQFYPGITVIASSISDVAKRLQKHVMNEIIELGCESLNITPAEITVRTREREISDKRMAIANILLLHFDHIIGYSFMAKSLGWANHCMILYSRNNADVVPVANNIKKIKSRYPFLADGFKTLR